MYTIKRTREWRKIGLMLATVILTASCNTQRTIQLTSKQPEPLQGEILMWVDAQLKVKEAQSSRSEKVFNDAIEEFRKLYPQVQVFTKIFPSGEIWESFELQVKRGSGPDLLLVKASTEISGLIQTGALKVIDESQIDQSRFRSEALKQVYYQGKLYGLPMYLSTKVLCYNKDKVKELPRTLPELIEQARKGYPVGVYSGFVETLWGTGVFGGRLFDPRGRVILAEGGVWAKGWAKWMKWLKQAQNEPNFILSDNAEALQQAFLEGQLTYLICPSGWIPDFSEALDKNKLGATPLPGKTNQPASPIIWAGILLFNQASSPNQTRLALKLAEFLTNVEQQKQIETAIPFISANKNVTLNPHLFPIRAILVDQSRTAVAFSLDDSEKVELLEDYGEILYQKILAGEMTPDEAATKLTQTVNRKFEGQ